MAELDGKVAVVTGGASGIGEATVRQFVEEGAKVVIADMQQERGQNLADELGDAAVFVAVESVRKSRPKPRSAPPSKVGPPRLHLQQCRVRRRARRSRISRSKSST